ncbi:hypothetical protein GCM10010345_82800 [Streptomyces canarius]|uniref:Uncharacterized protein n=1 Tax=Streptomyces canarius TaxID=285453 RepID=A0ABQ3D8N0_9ACTN|nr:hypothetical protein GCM10010345_82800 [Streptomyces canarius]
MNALLRPPGDGGVRDAAGGCVRAAQAEEHTARRIHQRPAQEYGFDQASYSTACDYVLARRPLIEAEVPKGRRHPAGMAPQVHLPGEEAERDAARVRRRLRAAGAPGAVRRPGGSSPGPGRPPRRWRWSGWRPRG